MDISSPGPIQLPGLDSAFLGLEADRQSGHVASLVILDTSGMDVPFDLAHYRALVAERLPRMGHFRKRLKHVPFGLDRPYWVDDVHFDLDYHVRELGLPRPGTMEVLLDSVARVHERPLDMSRPLWEAYIISGLPDGRVAIYTKVHHAVIDGATGVELLTAMVDLEPGVMPGEPTPFEPRREPSAARLLGRAALGLTSRPADMVRLGRSALAYLPALAFQAAPKITRALDPGDELDSAATPLRAPATPFNDKISAQRKIALTRLPLDDLRTIKNAAGVSINDVVIALTAAAVRDWLERQGCAVNEPLVSMVPVSLAADRSSGAGNSVTAMFTPLPIHLDDPLDRLQSAHATSSAAKSHGVAIPKELYEGGIQLTPPMLLRRGMRAVFDLGLMRRFRSFNLVLSNIPGPDITVYLGGARLETVYPLSIIVDGVGLNITLQGFGKHLGVGIVACRRAMPDVQSLADRMLEEVEVLLSAVGESAGGAGRG